MPTLLPTRALHLGSHRSLVRRLLSASAVGVALLGAAPAFAQSDREGSWRRSERPPESPQHFAIELRFGPYHPDVDDEFPQSKPFATAFGADRHPFYAGFEFDWQIFRIPKFGTLGPGFGLGYTHVSANATKVSDGKPSPEMTTLGILPMYAVGVLRVDVVARETAIPIVPYGKAGLGYALWWSGNDVGTQGKGHSWGTQYGLGAMLLLDSFDEHAAVELDNEWGINGTYFFAEWMVSHLNGFGDVTNHSVMHVGSNTWMMGLAIEM